VRDFAAGQLGMADPSQVKRHTERGDLENEFAGISEDEANQIVERIQATVTGASNG
jgi:hypothetical protein